MAVRTDASPMGSPFWLDEPASADPDVEPPASEGFPLDPQDDAPPEDELLVDDDPPPDEEPGAIVESPPPPASLGPPDPDPVPLPNDDPAPPIGIGGDAHAAPNTTPNAPTTNGITARVFM